MMAYDNPYNYNLPVEEKMFFGRDNNVRDIVEAVTHTPGDSFALIGGRRMGKTSMLEAIGREITRTQYYGDLYVIPIFIDMSGEEISSIAHFFQCVYDTITREVGYHSHLEYDANTSYQLTSSPMLQMRQLLQYWEQRVMQTMRYRLRIVLLLDECETIVNQGWDGAIHAILRSLLVGSLTRPSFKIIMAGSQRFLSHVRRVETSPLWNVLTYHMLETFQNEDTVRLINIPTNSVLSEETVNTIIMYSGGHPFLTQYIMCKLWKKGLVNNYIDDIHSISEKFYKERNDFHDWMNELSKYKKIIYSLMNILKYPVEENILLKNLEYSPIEINSTIEILCYHGIVSKSYNTAYHASSHMFNVWFENFSVPIQIDDQSSTRNEFTSLGDREIQELITIHQKNLFHIEQKIAKHGGTTMMPVDLMHERESNQHALDLLHREQTRRLQEE